MMEDKEVGALWYGSLVGRPDGPILRDIVQDFIRKLVDERTYIYFHGYGREEGEPQQLALRDFGIDPKDWPK